MTLAQAREYDRKRHLWPMGFGIVLVVGGLTVYGLLTGLPWLLFSAPVVVYGVVPLADWLIGRDSSNPPEGALAALEDDPYYRWSTYIYVLIELVFFGLVAWVIGTWSLSWAEWVGLTWTIGILSGISINTAHELGHKKPKLERWLALVALAPVAYGHFFVEHNKGHHRRVATPEDPASARMGESFWRFLPRTVIGSLRSAWEIERTRLARKGKGPWTWENENLQAWSMTVVLWGGLMAAFGVELFPFLVIQAALGASLLEAVNYVEHYGLRRQKLDNGRYERCRPEHSWNNDHIVTNIFLFHLQRHSDHHAHPTRRYQALRHFDDAPELPTGYAGMIVLAYLTPLWYRVMDPKVVRHYGGDIRRANLQPGREADLLAKYPPPAPAG
ncbi:alkane 1-monooxygenase [Salinisphaera sp. PC39]|uniref:alkane 1-monooxygenase n=1 Tax=Salinisphaera sp. PC39 TaxID=1304156 RepID=UPI0033429783